MYKTQKWFAITAIFLLLSLTFLPTVQSETQTKKSEELQEVTFEIHTLTGVKEITKKLSTTQIERITVLTEELKNNILTLQEPTATLIAQSEADNKINTILAELQDFGLLSDYSINEVKDLITGKYQQQIKNTRTAKIFEIVANLLDWDIANVLCLTHMEGIMIFDFAPKNILRPWRLLIDFLPRIYAFCLWDITRDGGLPPGPKPGGIYTYGLLGEYEIEAYSTNAFTIGFTGLVIKIPLFLQVAVGFSLFVVARGN